MSLLVPEFVFKDVTRIQPDFLVTHGIRGLVLDVDNTIAAHGSQEVRPEIEAWLRTMRGCGIHLMLASNNFDKRVRPLAQRLGLDYVSFCCKPLPVWMLVAMRKWNLPRGAIALVGDQLFTDYLAGSLYGAKVLVVRPMYYDPKPMVRFKRKLEKPLLLRYYLKGGKLR